MSTNLVNQVLPALSQKIPTLVVTIIVVFLTSGCGGPTAPPYKAYDGSVLYYNELAHLDWSKCRPGCVEAIEGKKLPVDALLVTGRYPTKQANLMPGKHTIRYGFGIHMENATIDMQAGHIYDVMGKKYSSRRFSWIVDITTGEVVHGDPL